MLRLHFSGYNSYVYMRAPMPDSAGVTIDCLHLTITRVGNSNIVLDTYNDFMTRVMYWGNDKDVLK